MNYNEFKAAVVESEQQFFPEHTIEIRQILKNNGLYLDALIIRAKESCISPSIYLDSFYDLYMNNEKELPDICMEIAEVYRRSVNSELCDRYAQAFLHREDFKEHLIFRLIDAGENEALLSDVPYRRFMNLAVVYCLYYKRDEDGNAATALIHTAHLPMLDLSEDQLYEIALENTPRLLPACFMSMRELLFNMMEHTPDSEAALDAIFKNAGEQHDGNMYVLTNDDKLYGASALLYPDILQLCARQIGGDYFILPSSIHEVILVPADEAHCPADRETLRDLVTQINATEVARTDRLCNEVYYYDERNATLTL